MEDTQEDPLAVRCFCVCSGSVLLGDLLGVSRSRERDLLSVLSVYPRIFLHVFTAYRLLVGLLFRSTSKSRPNNIRGGKMSVRPSVHKKVSSISMKFGIQVEVDEWCTTVCRMTGSKVKVKVTSPWKFEFLPFSKAISSAIYNGSWQVTTNS